MFDFLLWNGIKFNQVKFGKSIRKAINTTKKLLKKIIKKNYNSS